MPNTVFLTEAGHPEHRHDHENTDAEITGSERITEEENGPTDGDERVETDEDAEMDDAEYSFDSEDEAEDLLEYASYSYVNDDSPHQNVVVSSLLSQSEITSYDEFMIMFKNGSFYNSLNKEAHCHHLGHHNRPYRPAADPNLIYH